MTSLERLNTRLAGRPVDKIPNLSIVMGIVAREAGVSYREYVTDYRKLVEGNLICAEKYGFDSVSAISDPVREASAFGAKLVFPENGVPYAEAPLIKGDFDLSALKRFDPLESKRTLDRVRACEELRRRTGGEYPVIGWVEGCLAEAADLRGMSELMIDLASGEGYLDELLPIISGRQKLFARAQIEAGADFIGVGNAVASQIGPELYRAYGLAWDREIVEYVHSRGARVKLHICGNITVLLELLACVAPDILDIDWMVDFARAVKAFEGTGTAVSGNVNPVEIMMRGTPETVEKAVRACIAAGNAVSCIAAGCEIPALSPDKNLLAMNRALWQ